MYYRGTVYVGTRDLYLDSTSSYIFVVGENSVVDPDPDLHGPAFFLAGWIRIRNADPDLDPKGLKWTTKFEKRG
jgi:hypothetical protein